MPKRPSIMRGGWERGHGETCDTARLNSRFLVPPERPNLRTYWLTLAAGPICSRSASHPFETEVVVFRKAASRTLSTADFWTGSCPSPMRSAFAPAGRFSSHSSAPRPLNSFFRSAGGRAAALPAAAPPPS